MNTIGSGQLGVALSDLLLDGVVSDLSENGYSIIPDFISQSNASYFRSLIDGFHEQDEMEVAGIGKMNDFQVDRKVRGDLIRWIEKDGEDLKTEQFMMRMRQLMQDLNRSLFLGLKDFESHFTYYPQGKFYKRHSDQFNKTQHRVISFVCYLNDSWKPADGGELMIYLKETETKVQPLSGQLVIFRSEIEHEVLPTLTDRYSITGWMLDQLVGLTFL